jgi:hypothetical protein
LFLPLTDERREKNIERREKAKERTKERAIMITRSSGKN